MKGIALVKKKVLHNFPLPHHFYIMCTHYRCYSIRLSAVQKSSNPAVETAKKKAELEKRLQDVSGKLGKSKQKSKKGMQGYGPSKEMILVWYSCLH